MIQDRIVILDFGGARSTRLARAVRASGVYSEIYPNDFTAEKLAALPNVRGLIFDGEAPADVSDKLYACGLPILAAGAPAVKRGQELGAFSDDALRDFVFGSCGAQAGWNMKNFIAEQTELLREKVGGGRVLLALSGGVDSSVVAALLLRAVGQQLVCVHVNHGLMRKGESESVLRVFRGQMQANLVYVDAADRFLDKLAGVADPEQKRKLVGTEFVRVFEEEAGKLESVDFLAQGTIYPDVLESGSGTAKLVKSHHNVGGLPKNMKLRLIEPLRQLFKDEVRACGKALGLPDEMVYRQPFPGPGLGVRCLGAITRERLNIVRESDAVLRDELAGAGLSRKVWQYFTVVPDFRSVGVRDGARCYEYPVILRAVDSSDALTASAAPLDWELLRRITNRILKEVPGVNRVCLDLTPKPPGTIEWE